MEIKFTMRASLNLYADMTLSPSSVANISLLKLKPDEPLLQAIWSPDFFLQGISILAATDFIFKGAVEVYIQWLKHVVFLCQEVTSTAGVLPLIAQAIKVIQISHP